MRRPKAALPPFEAADLQQAERHARELAKAAKKGMCSLCADQTARAIATGRLSWLDRPGCPESSLCPMCEKRLDPPLERDGWTYNAKGERIPRWRVRRSWEPPPKASGPTKPCERDGCTEEFAPLRRSARYCSDLCKRAARRSKGLAKPEVAWTQGL